MDLLLCRGCTYWGIVRIHSIACSVKSCVLSWCGPNQTVLPSFFFFFFEATAASAAASIGPPQHCSLKAWMRIRVGGSEGWGEGWGGTFWAVQLSRRGESEGRETQRAADQGRKKKHIYEASVEDFLSRWRNSRMWRKEVSSSWWNSSDRFQKPPPEIIFTDVNIKMNTMCCVKKEKHTMVNKNGTFLWD